MAGRLPRGPVAPKAAEPQRVGNHEDRREPHGGRGNNRVEQPHRGKGDRGDVVGERPEEIALDRGEGAARKRDRVGRGPEVARDEREITRLDRDIGPGADGDAEVGLRECGGVVDPVTDDRDPPSLGLQLLHDVDLLPGEHPGDHTIDPYLDGNGIRGRLTVTRDHHRLDLETVQRGDRLT